MGYPLDDAASLCDAHAVPKSDRFSRERRLLTIVFIDLVQSTQLSAKLEAEDLAVLISAFQETGERIFTDLGGYIAQFLGDGLLVYFGYPRAHENDPERAIRASLALLAELPVISATLGVESDVLLQARVGIHTGLAIVGESVHDGRSVIFGEAINIAARIEATAAPGQICVSAATMQLVKGRFISHEIGPTEVKGVAEPIVLHAIERIASDRSVGGAPEDAFVIGRASHLARVVALFDIMRSEGARAVCITGEPGIGKSTLLKAFRATLDPLAVTWLEAKCDPFAAGTALHPFIALMRRSIGIPPDSDPVEGRTRLRRSLAALPEPMEDAFPVIARLLGIADSAEPDSDFGLRDPDSLRRQTLDIIAKWTRLIALRRPLVLVCEDLHWADSTTLELLEGLLTSAQPTQLFCFLTQRPAALPLALARHVEGITLDGLGVAEAELLARQAASPQVLAAPLLANVVARGNGNPLFIVELARYAAEASKAGRQDMQVPPSLNSLVHERLDRLPQEAKYIAQLASALGREFDVRFLAAVAEIDEEALAAATGLLFEAGILSETLAVSVYQFSHALTQDAAYGTLIRAEREAIHARAADCLRGAFSSLVMVQPEMVAHHLLAANKPAESADWFRKAGRRAAEQAAVEEAVVLYRRGLQALSGATAADDGLELSLQILLGNALMGVRGFGSAEIPPVWERALVLAEQRADFDETSSALNGLAAYYLGTGDCPRGNAFASRILARVRPGQDRIGRLRAHSSLAVGMFQIGAGHQALHHAVEAIALYQPGDFQTVTYGVGTDQGVIAYGSAAAAAWWIGQPDAALDYARQGLALAQSLPSVLSLAAARSFLAMTHHYRRDHQQAFDEADANVAHCQRYGIPFWLGTSQMIRAAQPMAPAAQRLPDIYAAQAMLAETGSRSAIGLGLAILAEAQLADQSTDASLQVLDMGLQLGAVMGQHFYDAELLRLKGEVLHARGDRAGADEMLDAAIAESRDRGSASLWLRAAVARAKLFADSPHADACRAEVSTALEIFKEGADSFDAREAAIILGGRPTEPAAEIKGERP